MSANKKQKVSCCNGDAQNANGDSMTIDSVKDYYGKVRFYFRCLVGRFLQGDRGPFGRYVRMFNIHEFNLLYIWTGIGDQQRFEDFSVHGRGEAQPHCGKQNCPCSTHVKAKQPGARMMVGLTGIIIMRLVEGNHQEDTA
jgi:hypothetical protein